MREIKFRAWDKTNKQMITTCGPLNLRLDGVVWAGLGDGYDNVVNEPDPTVLMQYTGLKDKNGKEIYEGDIVEVNDRDKSKYEILWRDDKARFVKRKLGGWFLSAIFNSNARNGCKYKVIGNIYSNPELKDNKSVDTSKT